MQTCPRCGAQNPDARAACIVCLAQLRKPGAQQVVRDAKQSKQSEPEAQLSSTVSEARQETVVSSTVAEAEATMLEEQVETSSAPEQSVTTEPSEAELKAESDSPRFVLDVEETTAERKQTKTAVSREESLPGSRPTPGERPETRIPDDASRKTFSVEEARRQARARLAKKQKRTSAAWVALALVVVVGVAVWWFISGNPSPADSAKAFVHTINPLYNGDLEPLRTICTSESTRNIASADIALGSILPVQLPSVMLSPLRVDSVTVKGKTAEVKLTVRYAHLESNKVGEFPMHVALVKEGSFLRPIWKVDLTATQRLQQQERGTLENLAQQLRNMTQTSPLIPGMPPR